MTGCADVVIINQVEIGSYFVRVRASTQTGTHWGGGRGREGEQPCDIRGTKGTSSSVIFGTAAAVKSCTDIAVLEIRNTAVQKMVDAAVQKMVDAYPRYVRVGVL